MKYLVAGFAFFGGYLVQASRFPEESSTVSRASGVTDLRSKYSNRRALPSAQQLVQRSLVFTRDIDDYTTPLLPRGSKRNSNSGQQGIVRASSPGTPANAAAAVPLEQQQQARSQSPQTRQQSPDPLANAPRRSSLPSVPRIRVTPPSSNTQSKILRGRIGSFLRPTPVRKQPANQGQEVIPEAPTERISLANSLASQSPPKSPGRPRAPGSPNTMLNKELDYLAKGKWTRGTQPFDGKPHGLTGEYVKAAGLWHSQSPPRSKPPSSPVYSSSSSSALVEEVPLSRSPSPPRVQVAALAPHDHDRVLPNPWTTFPPTFPPSFW